MADGLNVKRSEPTGISVLISGGGVGGLAAALECWRHGMDVRVIERVPENITSGDSFSIGPSAFTTFKYWPEMEARRAEIAFDASVTVCDSVGNKLRGPMDMKDMIAQGSIPQALLDRTNRYDRPKFHAMLLEQLNKVGLQVEYGKQVVDFFEDADAKKAGVVLKDGSKLEADLVIAADGVRTASWGLVAGHPVPAKSSGRAIFRVAFPLAVAQADQEIAERFQMNNGRADFEMWNGDGISFGIGKTLDQAMWFMDHEDRGTAEESWAPRITATEALKHTEHIKNWPAIARKFIEITPAGKIVDWKLMWRDPQTKWHSPAGRVIQLGDAAHTFLPSSGNGGTQATEDAVSLAQCLAIAGPDGIPEATRVHNLLRFERVSFLQAMGVANREIRDRSKNGQLVHAGFGMWILAHDPAQYASDNYHAALANVQTGAPFKSTNTPKSEYRPWTMDSLTDDLANGRETLLDGDWS